MWGLRAAFVCSGAVGMAFGPLLALVFKMMPTIVLLGLTFDPVTMAAWTMIICWLVFFVAWMALFPEPPIRSAPRLDLRLRDCVQSIITVEVRCTEQEQTMLGLEM